MDGDLSKNLEGVEQAMNAMYEGGMGYFTVTMDSDTCIAPKPDGTFCGFHGVINGKCPKCGNALDKYILRVRRITGYLTGSPRKRLELNWNPGKIKELGDRVSI
jgi:anaerobic ribonucleoside-triphosphate reductase